MSTVSIRGQTFMHKDELKKKGCSWNVDKKLWQIVSDYVTEGLIQYCLANNLKLDGYEAIKEIELSWPEGLQPYPYQIEGAKFALQRQSTLIADEMGLGKGHPYGTDILTPNGWVKIEKIKVGDQVIGSQGKPIKITGVYPRGILDVYNVTMNDGSNVKVDGEHLWSVQHVRNGHRNPNQWHTKDTLWLSKNLKDGSGNLTWKIPTVKPVQFLVKEDVPFHPYIMGVLLGNGALNNSALTFTTSDIFIVEKIKTLLSPDFFINPHKDPICYGIVFNNKKKHSDRNFRNPIRKYLDDHGLRCTTRGKFIPDIFKRSSIKDRLSLLNGLMDCDGSCLETINEFTTVSERLSYDVQEIVESLGGIVRRGIKKIPNGFCYRLNIKMNTNPFSLPRKADKWIKPTKYKPSRNIEKIEPCGKSEVICLSVDAPDKLYVTKNFIVTHNTIQALLVLKHTPGTCLVVCPASIKLNWLREIRKWCPEREFLTTITSWASLHKVKDKTFDLVIGDESHYAKNPDSKRTKNMKQICLKAGRKLFLTGTPVLAKPQDIFSLIDMAKHPLAKNWYFFARRYCGMYQDKFGNMVFGEPKNLDELKENLKGFMIRRVKSDVLDFLPPKVRSLLDLEIEDEYIKALIMAEGVASNRSQITEKKKKLFEKHNIEFNQLAKVRSELGVVKAPAVIERIKEMMEEIESLVVFWTHRKPLHMCMEDVQEFNPVCVVGDMKVEERQEAVDLFQSGKSRVIFLTFGAGAEGITLTKAQNVIMAELDWTPAKLLQAEDRCILEGQKVLTNKGWIAIENIEKGDRVLTREGTFGTVIDAWSRGCVKSIVEIEVKGWSDPICCTFDHEFLSEYEGWKKAIDLKLGEKLSMPKCSKSENLDFIDFDQDCRVNKYFKGSFAQQSNGRLLKAPEKIELSLDALFTFGYFIGDGFSCTDKGKGRFISFAGHREKKAKSIDRCIKWCKSQGMNIHTRQGSGFGIEIRSYSAEWAYWFKKHFGHMSQNKKIPEFLFGLSEKQTKAILDGLMSSDGYFRKNRFEYITSSEVLASQVARLIINIGKSPCVTKNTNGHYVISYSTLNNSRSGTITKITHRFTRKNGVHRERVYDLTIDTDPSFVVGLSVAHNCHRISQKGSVHIEYITFAKSIDHKILRSLMKKTSIINQILDGEDLSSLAETDEEEE